MEERKAPKGKRVTLAIEDLKTADALQMRVGGLSRDHAEGIAEAIKRHDAVPAVQVVRVGEVHYVVDGHHVLEAHVIAGRKNVVCEVREGTWEDAVLAAGRANKEWDAGGLKRTNADKVRAVRMMLATFPGWTDRRIGAEVGVAHTMVAAYRPREEPGATEPEEAGGDGPAKKPAAKRVGRDNRQYAPRKAPKPGAPKVDWARLDAHLGHLMRWPEELVKAHPELKDHPLYKSAVSCLEELAKVKKELFLNLTGKK